MNSTINDQGPSGLLLIDKPTGISSFDIIRSLRRQTRIRKIGHAGTLDPMASGLMLMLFNRATKQAGALSGCDKTYVADIILGHNSSTGDQEGELTAISDKQPDLQELTRAINGFIGGISQVPSQYSAIKVNGVRAYKLAREGKTVIMPPRQVTIHEIIIHNYTYPHLKIETSVSSGTYIRSLAQDIGEALGTGAYLGGLRRTKIGDYTVDKATGLDLVTNEGLAALLIGI